MSSCTRWRPLARRAREEVDVERGEPPERRVRAAAPVPGGGVGVLLRRIAPRAAAEEHEVAPNVPDDDDEADEDHAAARLEVAHLRARSRARVMRHGGGVAVTTSDVTVAASR